MQHCRPRIMTGTTTYDLSTQDIRGRRADARHTRRKEARDAIFSLFDDAFDEICQPSARPARKARNNVSQSATVTARDPSPPPFPCAKIRCDRKNPIRGPLGKHTFFNTSLSFTPRRCARAAQLRFRNTSGRRAAAVLSSFSPRRRVLSFANIHSFDDSFAVRTPSVRK